MHSLFLSPYCEIVVASLEEPFALHEYLNLFNFIELYDVAGLMGELVSVVIGDKYPFNGVDI